VERSIVVADARENLIDDEMKSDVRQLERGHLNLLLIDEVDVFFSQEFYGSTYDPIREYACPEAAAILTKIWQDRNSNISIQSIQRMPELAALKAKFRPEVIEDVKAYDNP